MLNSAQHCILFSEIVWVFTGLKIVILLTQPSNILLSWQWGVKMWVHLLVWRSEKRLSLYLEMGNKVTWDVAKLCNGQTNHVIYGIHAFMFEIFPFTAFWPFKNIHSHVFLHLNFVKQFVRAGSIIQFWIMY